MVEWKVSNLHVVGSTPSSRSMLKIAIISIGITLLYACINRWKGQDT